MTVYLYRYLIGVVGSVAIGVAFLATLFGK